MTVETAKTTHEEFITIRNSTETLLPQNTGISTLDVLAECISQGAIRKDPGNSVSIDYEKTYQILENFEPPSGPTRDVPDTDESFKIPEDQNLQEQCKDTVREVIHIAYRDLNLIDSQTLADAVRFAGPGNTVFANKYSSLFLTLYVEDQHNNHNWHPKDPLPPPKSTKIRNEAPTALFIGRPALNSYTNDMLRFAKTADLTLTTDDALKLAMTHIAAHEFGHAVTYALDANYRSIHKKIKEVSKGTWLDDIRNEIPSILEENFSQGFADVIVKRYGEKFINLSPSEVGSLLLEQKYFSYSIHMATDRLVKYAKVHGISVRELIGTDLQIRNQFSNHNVNDGDLLYSIIAYSIPEFSRDEIQKLTGVKA